MKSSNKEILKVGMATILVMSIAAVVVQIFGQKRAVKQTIKGKEVLYV